MDTIAVIRTTILLCCIYPNLHGTTNNRIIGGRPANEREIPYQVSLRRSYSDEHFCGGTLITPKHILTAAHCMYYSWGGILPPIVVSVVAGQLTLAITTESIYRNASLITIHSDFDKTNMANDIAIIEVDEPFEPVETNRLISTVPLRNDSIYAGLCFVSGWGVEVYSSNIVSNILLITDVSTIEFERCEYMYNPNVTLSEGMLCAGHENGTTDACKGDSGGPLVCDGLLTGIVSSGIGCGSAEHPGVYTKVAHFIPWILSVIKVNTSSFPDSDEDFNNFTSSGHFLSNKIWDRNRADITFNLNSCVLVTLLYILYKL